MKAGETRYIARKLELKKPYDAVRFRLSNDKNTIKKSTDAELDADKVLERDGVFLIPLQQSDTASLVGSVTLESEIDYGDHSVIYTDDNHLYINDSLGWDPVDGSHPSEDDGIDVVMTAIEEGVAVIVNPEASQELIDAITELFQDTKEIAQSVRDDADAGRFDGEDGYSPQVTVAEETSSTYKLDIKTADDEYETPNLKGQDGKDGKDGRDGVDGKDGSDGRDGRDGVDGKDGQDGADGFSPTVTVKTQTSTDYVLEITDKNGSYDTPNLQGQKGDKGDRGDGTVIDSASGSAITLTDSASDPLESLKICGKSTQNGTPTIDNPIPITNADTDITINSTLHEIDIATLRGIPVASDGNYTDENNQQWLCDTIEKYADGSGKLIQRVHTLTLDGSEPWTSGGGGGATARLVATLGVADSTSADIKSIFEGMQLVANASQVSNTDNAYIIANGRMLCSPTTNGQRMTTASQWVTFLQSNNLKLYSPLETPIETPLTAEQLAELDLDTYYPTTNISSECGLVVEYVCDTKNYIDRKIAEAQ